MELEKELIDKHELSTDAVTAINATIKDVFSESDVADLKGEWDGKANEGAQGIIDGAITATQKKTGFSLDRNQPF